MDTEDEFKKMVAWYEGSRKRKNATGREAVLRFLLEHPNKLWWWSWEFIGQTTRQGDFLSHRSPARASDLALTEPLLVEDRKVGRFKCYRLRWENMDLIKIRLGITSNQIQPITPALTKKIYVPVVVDGKRMVRELSVPA